MYRGRSRFCYPYVHFSSENPESGGFMAERHIVKQGECIALLAKDRGFITDTIWNHPENKDLKKNERTQTY